MLLLGILVSLIIFIILLSTFICWKCRKNKNKEKIINEEELIIKDKEQEKLLFLNGATANILNGKYLKIIRKKLNSFNILLFII